MAILREPDQDQEVVPFSAPPQQEGGTDMIELASFFNMVNAAMGS